MGKTRMHELAYGVTSINPVFGPVLNPYDVTKIPGGAMPCLAGQQLAIICPKPTKRYLAILQLCNHSEGSKVFTVACEEVLQCRAAVSASERHM